MLNFAVCGYQYAVKSIFKFIIAVKENTVEHLKERSSTVRELYSLTNAQLFNYERQNTLTVISGECYNHSS